MVLVCIGLVDSGLYWIGWVWFVLDWLVLVYIGLVSSGLYWIGWFWFILD